jgi:hypothetical protein
MTSPALAREGLRLPSVAWTFGLTWVVDGVLQLLRRGVNDSDGLALVASAVLSAAVVTWFAAGVLRARGFRLVVVWIAIVLGGLLELLALADADFMDLSLWVMLAVTAAQVVTLRELTRTPYFHAQQAQRGRVPVDLGGLLAVAVLVGVMGGMTAPATGSDGQSIHVGL